jgi:hypothetical protein
MSSEKKSFSFSSLVGWICILNFGFGIASYFIRAQGTVVTKETVELLSFEEEPDSALIKATLKRNDGSKILVQYDMRDDEYVKEARNFYKSKPGDKSCATLLIPTKPIDKTDRRIELNNFFSGPCTEKK